MTILTCLACAACYGDPSSSLTQGMNMAIVTMLVVTFGVLGGLAGMIVHFAKRARRQAGIEAEMEQVLKDPSL